MFATVIEKSFQTAILYVPGIPREVHAFFSQVKNSTTLELGETVSCNLRRIGSDLCAEQIRVLFGKDEEEARRRMRPLEERDRGWTPQRGGKPARRSR